jgi:PKD repeat protein
MNKKIIGIFIVFFLTNFFPIINSGNKTATASSLPGSIIIYNPYEEINFTTVHHYKANLHTHTTQSDGGSPPSTVINHYCNIGSYDILAITDHDTNTWPWSNWITGNTPEYESSSSAYFPTLRIGVLAISGNEASGDPPSGHDHGSLLNDYAGNGENPTTSLQYIQNHNGLSFFYHPGRYHYSIDWYNNWFDTYNISIGIEAFNQGDKYPNDRIKWDSINKQRAPNNLIWGFSDDDMHDLSTQAFRNYQHFLMNNLTEAEFRNAMINGAFYFSYEPNGANSTSLTYGQAVTPKLTNVVISGDIITITGEDYTSIQWYNQTTSIVGTGISINLSSLDYTKFVRAVLTNANGSTYTQPFGFEEYTPQNVYYTLTTTIVGSGVVTPVSGSLYLVGTIVPVSATPNAGWQFSSWGGDLTGNTNPTRITMNGNKNVIANFTKISSPNNPPKIPFNPTPNNHTSVNINQDLYWNGGDPDIEDTITYDVYFSTTSPPIKIISNQSATSYNPGTMNYNKKYYWKIIAWDNHGVYSTSPIWDFTIKSSNRVGSGIGRHCSDSTTSLVNTPPVADSNGPYYEYVNNQFTFNGSNCKDSDGNITNYTWVFGDGNTGTGKTTVHTYYKIGNYTITLTVTDDGGKNDTDTTYVLITEKPNYPPIADFSYFPLNPKTDDIIQFIDLSTDTDGTIVSYYWNFNDGRNTTDKNPNHTYITNGTYLISLIIKDNNNATDTISKVIIVNESQNKVINGNENNKGTIFFELIFVNIWMGLVLFSKRRRIKYRLNIIKKSHKTRH